jgi:hypothetical protein
MRIAFDHAGFQQGAMGAVALGGAGGLGATLAGADAVLTAAATVGAAALPLGRAVFRAWRDGRRAASTVGALAAVGAAWPVWLALAGGAQAVAFGGPEPFAAAGLGLVAGLVVSLGLVGCFLRITRNPIAEAIEVARPDLDTASLALCQRAAAAAAKLRGAEVAEVEEVARRVVLEIVALSRRQRAIAREADAPSAGELETRIADLDARLATVTDEVARESYLRARAAIEDQRRRLASLRVTADRVLARLHTEVAALEGAALAIAARGGAATAADASALTPLADRLRGASGDLDLEAEAVREAAAI